MNTPDFELTALIQREVKLNIDPSASFPCMLHQCLRDIEALGQRDPAMQKLSAIVGWQKQGAAFRVHDKHQFEALIMPVWFIRLKYSSFVRLLSLYGFKKIHKDTQDAQKGGTVIMFCFVMPSSS
jgi:HSF-type DNA-binding